MRGPDRGHAAREEENVVLRDRDPTHALCDLDLATGGTLVAHEHAGDTAAHRALRQLCRCDVQIPSVALLEIHGLVCLEWLRGRRRIAGGFGGGVVSVRSGLEMRKF